MGCFKCVRMKLSGYLILAFLVSSCGTYYVKYEEPQSDIITTDELRSFIKNQNNTSILLRVPESSKSATEQLDIDVSTYYNILEKEFLRGGFEVKDRGLFNQIATSFGGLDYSELRDKTDTDIIIELVNLDFTVPYETNTYYSSDSNQNTFRGDESLTTYGAKVEFKIVLVENNQFAGNYVFHYAPCEDGCEIKFRGGTGKNPAFKSGETIKIDEPYQFVMEESSLERFMRDAANRLISELDS